MEKKPVVIEKYIPHDGTVMIAGSTAPKGAGNCAWHFFERGTPQIDFLCIGANANQQATKAMGVFLFMTKNYAKVEVAFQPLRYMVETLNHETQQLEQKDCTVWRTVILDRSNDRPMVPARN